MKILNRGRYVQILGVIYLILIRNLVHFASCNDDVISALIANPSFIIGQAVF